MGSGTPFWGPLLVSLTISWHSEGTLSRLHKYSLASRRSSESDCVSQPFLTLPQYKQSQPLLIAAPLPPTLFTFSASGLLVRKSLCSGYQAEQALTSGPFEGFDHGLGSIDLPMDWRPRSSKHVSRSISVPKRKVTWKRFKRSGPVVLIIYWVSLREAGWLSWKLWKTEPLGSLRHDGARISRVCR